MEATAVILGADGPFGRALCECVLDRGWSVFGGSADGAPSTLGPLTAAFPGRFHAVPMDPLSMPSLETAASTVAGIVDHVDLLVCHADLREEDSFRGGLNFEPMTRVYDVNALGPVRFVEAFLPWMNVGMKRLCFVTDAAGSIGASSGGGDNVAYSMSKAALHMAVMILSNHLRKEGYTFRLYVPRDEPEADARFASDYFFGDRDDEFRMTLVDGSGAEWPF